MQKHLDPTTVHCLIPVESSAERSRPDVTESTPQSNLPRSDDDTADVGAAFGSLAMGDGRSRYVTGNFWARLDDEVSGSHNLSLPTLANSLTPG